ncbi:MAG: HAMP domain-containing histidine kinase, partial [Myxococcales bacterium]|nr:HAMP domain-containing histidine kinase [Myxococcales bacterium]
LLKTASADVDCEIEIHHELAPESWPLDPERIREVIVNILRNAHEVAPGKPVRVDMSNPGDELVVGFQDQGPGLPEDAEKLFKPFVTTKTKGTGLGLAIVSQIVRAHGGTISARNASEGGAYFELRLPSKLRQARVRPLV